MNLAKYITMVMPRVPTLITTNGGSINQVSSGSGLYIDNLWSGGVNQILVVVKDPIA